MRKVSRTCCITNTATQRKSIMHRIFLLKENEWEEKQPMFFLFLFDSSQISVFITSFNVVMKQNIKPKQEHSNESLFEKKISLYNKNFHKTWECPSWPRLHEIQRRFLFHLLLGSRPDCGGRGSSSSSREVILKQEPLTSGMLRVSSTPEARNVSAKSFHFNNLIL